MILYTKQINNKQEIKPANKIILIKDNMQIINPTEKMLFEDGWVEYSPIIHEPTAEELLNREKEFKIEEILRYDSSNDVNGFYVNNAEIWLDKATRVGLKLRFDAEIASGKTDTVLWYEGNQFPMTLENALLMLNSIELYASACYDNTQKHISVVKSITTLEELMAYDYLDGYPDKLRF